MRVFVRLKVWREARKIQASRERLMKQSRTVLSKPDPRCQRNSVEAVP
jgi:hypothetical protein